MHQVVLLKYMAAIFSMSKGKDLGLVEEKWRLGSTKPKTRQAVQFTFLLGIIIQKAPDKKLR